MGLFDAGLVDNGLVLKAHGHLFHATLDLRVLKKKRSNSLFDKRHFRPQAVRTSGCCRRSESDYAHGN